MRCYHLGSAYFNLLLFLFLKDHTTRRKSFGVPEEIKALNSAFKEIH